LCFAFAPRGRPTAGALAAALTDGNAPAAAAAATTAMVAPIPSRRAQTERAPGDEDDQRAKLRRDNEALKAQLAVVTSKLLRYSKTRISHTAWLLLPPFATFALQGPSPVPALSTESEWSRGIRASTRFSSKRSGVRRYKDARRMSSCALALSRRGRAAGTQAVVSRSGLRARGASSRGTSSHLPALHRGMRFLLAPRRPLRGHRTGAEPGLLRTRGA
jgi:hypothetical protein